MLCSSNGMRSSEIQCAGEDGCGLGAHTTLVGLALSHPPPSPMTTRLSFDGERADVSNQRRNESKARTLVMPVKKSDMVRSICAQGTQYLCAGHRTFGRVATWDGDGSGWPPNLGE